MSHSASEENGGVDDEMLFLADVARWTEDVVATFPPSLEALLQQLPGVEPLLVRDELRRIAGLRGARAEVASALLAARPEAPTRAPTRRPIPHPLEFDWRFSPETTQTLVGRLSSISRAGVGLAYLGAPSVFAHAREALPDRRHLLLDAHIEERTGRPASGSGLILQRDLLRDPLPEFEAFAVVADPPWYPEHMRAFLWSASELLAEGGILLTSFPAAGTRPGVVRERDEFLEWSAPAGMLLVSDDPGGVCYQTPPFEAAALRAAGFEVVPMSWRRGDLLTLRKIPTSTSMERPHPPADEGWTKFVIDEIPLFVRVSSHDQHVLPAPLLEQLVAGDVLASVSRRHPARAHVVMWSSLNRVYGSLAAVTVAAIVDALARNDDALAAATRSVRRELSRAEQDSVEQAESEIRALVRREREEHGLDG